MRRSFVVSARQAMRRAEMVTVGVDVYGPAPAVAAMVSQSSASARRVTPVRRRERPRLLAKKDPLPGKEPPMRMGFRGTGKYEVKQRHPKRATQ